MPRFAAIQNNEIRLISNQKIHHSEMKVLEVPESLKEISSDELIASFRVRDNEFISKNSKKSASKLKIALVGNWKMKCGIATYSENLWSEVIKHVGDYKLFVEKHDTYTGSLNYVNGTEISADKVVVCWKRGESLQELVNQIKQYDPDIVWIQHEFGLWANAGYWLALMTQLSNYRVIVTMHSVFHHRDKTICEAAIPEIIVHLEGAKKVLQEEKGITSKIHVIPHGCFPCTNKEKLWNFYRSDHTFIQAGFLFRYKGWQESIKAVSLLKKKYPDVFFTGLCSESDYNKAEHQLYYRELLGLIQDLNIQDNVALIRGFQSDQAWDSYFRTNKLAVFPYISEPEHEVFGASGAARIAMTKNLPVITSPVNHFSDLPTIKASTAEEMATEIDKLFSNNKLVETQLNKQISFLEENSWAKIAEKHISIFENPNLIIK